MAVHFHRSSAFEEIRSQIEQHLFDAVFEIEKDLDLAIRSVDQFTLAVDRLMDTLEHDFDITFLDIDDNRQSNLDRFPSHRLITFDDES